MDFIDYFPLTGFLLMLIFAAGRIYLLKQKQIQVISISSHKNQSVKVLYLIFALIFLLWLFELIRTAFQLSFSILPEQLTKLIINCVVAKIVGAILISLAFIFWTVTLVHFKTSLRMGLNENNRGKLITTGIFSLSRNPFFLSLDLYFCGVALIFPTVFIIGFTVTAIVGIHFFILKEERFLLNNYGEDYKKYQKNTSRYITLFKK